MLEKVESPLLAPAVGFWGCCRLRSHIHCLCYLRQSLWAVILPETDRCAALCCPLASLLSSTCL